MQFQSHISHVKEHEVFPYDVFIEIFIYLFRLLSQQSLHLYQIISSLN